MEKHTPRERLLLWFHFGKGKVFIGFYLNTDLPALVNGLKSERWNVGTSRKGKRKEKQA